MNLADSQLIVELSKQIEGFAKSVTDAIVAFNARLQRIELSVVHNPEADAQHDSPLADLKMTVDRCEHRIKLLEQEIAECTSFVKDLL